MAHGAFWPFLIHWDDGFEAVVPTARSLARFIAWRFGRLGFDSTFGNALERSVGRSRETECASSTSAPRCGGRAGASGANLDARRRLAGTRDHRDRAASLRVIDTDRQKAVLVVMGVKQRQLLMTVRHVAGVVDVERDRGRQLVVRRHSLIDPSEVRRMTSQKGAARSQAGTRSVASTNHAPYPADARRRV